MRALRERLWEGTRHLGYVLVSGVRLEVHHCGTCGVMFGLEENFNEARREDGGDWCCPNGHVFVYNGGKTKLELAKAEAARLTARLDQERAARRTAERSASAHKGVATRIKNRAKAGVCPVDGCQRHFENLERHIASKHPGYPGEPA